jgi:hypothetical protein
MTASNFNPSRFFNTFAEIFEVSKIYFLELKRNLVQFENCRATVSNKRLCFSAIVQNQNWMRRQQSVTSQETCFK